MKKNGFTLVELMITLVIAAGLLSLGLITMRGYIPKQRLISTTSELENILHRAQAEASSRAYWSCVTFSSETSPQVTLRMDVDGNRDCEGSDQLITQFRFKDQINLPPDSGAPCSKNVNSDCTIWFDTTGIPKNCGSNCPDSPGGGDTNCVDGNFQIILSHAKLESGSKAREVEVNSGGLIQTVKPNSSNQLLTTMWAKHPEVAGAGCE